jgi:hypothetical protein
VRLKRVFPIALAVAALCAALPSPAAAHGPVAPVATSYLATVAKAPPGVQVKIVDGYVRIWMHVPPDETLTVLDYRGAPYVRFSPSGVEVNRNSEMFYFNQTPASFAVPRRLTRSTPPRWVAVSSGHSYEWHDGRLQALSGVALQPGQTYLGSWAIPVVVGGHTSLVTGGVWHQNRPSPIWFWPIAVLLLCTLAARRLARPELDRTLAKCLSLVSLVAIALAAAGLGLHGRPGVPAFHVVEFVVLLAFSCWGVIHLTRHPPEALLAAVIAIVSLWQGIKLLPTLLHPFVLIGPSAGATRIVAVTCLSTGVSLLPLVPRLIGHSDSRGEPAQTAVSVVER